MGLTRNKSSFSLNPPSNNFSNEENVPSNPTFNSFDINNFNLTESQLINSTNNSNINTFNSDDCDKSLERDSITNILRKRFNSFSAPGFDFVNSPPASAHVSSSFSSNSFMSNNFNDNLMALNKIDTELNGNNANSFSTSSTIQQQSQPFRNFRHNSIIGSSNNTLNNNGFINPPKEHRALSFSNNIDNNNDNNNKAIINNSSNLYKPNYVRPREVITYSKNLPCLSTNCLFAQNANNTTLSNINKLVKFACNSCQTIRFMHQICYDYMFCNLGLDNIGNGGLVEPRNTTNFYKTFEIHRQPEFQKLHCNNCLNGILMIVYSNNINNSININNSNVQTNGNNPANMSLNVRKKSLNNPPLPMPMQPVRESRSPSPNSISFLNNSNKNQSSLFQHAQINKLTKKTSSPVNMPKNGRSGSSQRYRTMSTGSTGSFSAASSFSSSVGNSFQVGSPNVANNQAWVVTNFHYSD